MSVPKQWVDPDNANQYAAYLVWFAALVPWEFIYLVIPKFDSTVLFLRFFFGQSRRVSGKLEAPTTFVSLLSIDLPFHQTILWGIMALTMVVLFILSLALLLRPTAIKSLLPIYPSIAIGYGFLINGTITLVLFIQNMLYGIPGFHFPLGTIVLYLFAAFLFTQEIPDPEQEKVA